VNLRLSTDTSRKSSAPVRSMLLAGDARPLIVRLKQTLLFATVRNLRTESDALKKRCVRLCVLPLQHDLGSVLQSAQHKWRSNNFEIVRSVSRPSDMTVD